MRATDYHEYVIKDGRFIGAFEEMYRACPDPWHQDEVQPLVERIALSMLSQPCHRVLDIGCGKGRFTNLLKSVTGGVLTALDISPTAVSIARSRYPQIEFMAASIPPLPFNDECFDLVVSSELLWYVLRDLSPLFEEIKRVLAPGGRYLIIQKFYSPEEQSWGREVMQTPQDLLVMLPFRLVHHVEADPSSNHKLVALLERSG